MTVSSCHVTYAFQSESTLYCCVNVKEVLARSRREIWSLSDCKWTRIQNHLVRKQTPPSISPHWLNDWALFRLLICTVHLTFYSNHVTYSFESESTLYSCLNVKELLARSRCQIWSWSDCNWTRTQNPQFVNEHSTICPNWPNDWAVFWVIICTVHLTVCSCHVPYKFQNESTLCSCSNVNEILSPSRREIWSWSDRNWTPTHNYLVTQLFGQTDHMIELCFELFSARSIWLYVLVMSRTHFKVNPHTILAWMLRNSLLEAGAKSDV